MPHSAKVSNEFSPARRARDAFWDSRAFALASAVGAVLNVLPASLARWLGRGAGSLAYTLARRYRRQVLQNMEIAFRDEKTREEKEQICHAYFQHLGLSLAEFARLPRLTAENMNELVDLGELKEFDRLLAKGKGLLCVPAHHGNWELCGYCVALRGYALKSVARPLDNPQLNAFVTDLRVRSGNELIYKWKVLWKLKKLLDNGAIVTMSIDQNGGVGGLFVPCFGTLASTVASPAELHLATRSPIVVTTLNRQPDGVRHVLRIWDVIEHPPGQDHDADVRAITTRINAAIEKAVRQYPEQWLWVHRRWKTRPPNETPGPDGLPPRASSQ